MPAALQERTSTVSQPSVAAAESDSTLKAIAHLFELRSLIRLMVWRDFMGRYKGSLLGAFWPLINPLGHLLLYTFLFCVVLKVKFGDDPSTANFALYLMAGLLPWGALAESLSRPTTLILESPNLVKRVVFPLEVLPVVLVISSMLSEMVAMVILLAASILYCGTIHASLLFLPLIMTSQILLMAGLSFLLSSLGVYVRDFRHIMSLALAAWMYATPIVYPASALPKNFSFLNWINPMSGIVGDYRNVILVGQAPSWPNYAVYTTMAVVAFWLGFTFFYKTKKSFADVM